MTNSCDTEFMEYVNENSIDPNLVCNICHKPLKDPVCTSCDHTYGRQCIIHWLTTNKISSCPICVKQPLSTEELTQASRPLRNMLDQLRIRCVLCDETGLQRGNFTDHMNKFCPKAIIECKAADIKCPWKGPREELEKHVLTCVFEPLRPVLASLMEDNRKLNDQVQKQGNEIKKLTEKISQMSKATAAANVSDDDSDNSSVAERFSNDPNQKEEDAIYITNLPSTIKFNDLFGVFSQIGRIKCNPKTQKANVFIFENPNQKGGLCSAKIIYDDKKSANTAVAEYNEKHIPQWNTRIRVSISTPGKKNMNHPQKNRNVRNTRARRGAKATGDNVKVPDMPAAPDSSQSRNESNQETSKTDNQRSYLYKLKDKTTN